MLWTTVPGGMFLSGRALPIRISASGPELIFIPTLRPSGCRYVALLAIRVIEQRDARGTVGIVFDGCDHGRNADLVALEIDHAIGCLCPPPMKRLVTRPVLLRPPVRWIFSTSDFSGRCLVMSCACPPSCNGGWSDR